MRSCRTCAFCHYREQYCAKRDMDMSKQFMLHNYNCRDHRYQHELDEEEEMA